MNLILPLLKRPMLLVSLDLRDGLKRVVLPIRLEVRDGLLKLRS